MLSVDQINAQIKSTEIWKKVVQSECPLQIIRQAETGSEQSLRSMRANDLGERGVLELFKATFINDGVRLWNKAPDTIKS